MNSNNLFFKYYFRENKWAVIFLVLALSMSTINIYISLICFPVLVLLGAFKRNVRTGTSYLLLLLLSFLFYFFDAYSNPYVTFQNVLWHSVLPFLAFVVGRQIAGTINSERSFFFWILVIMLSLALDSVPITIVDIYNSGLINPERILHVISDTHETQRLVTSRAMDLALALSGICCLFFLKTKYREINLWFVIMSIIALLCTIHYVSRTGIVLFAIALFVGVLYSKKNIMTTSIILLIILGLLLIAQTSVFSIYEARLEENTTFASGRSDRWLWGLIALIENPHGYSYLTEGTYAHNYWLDFGREGGLIAAVLLFVFSAAILIKTVIISITNKTQSLNFRCIILSSMVVCFVAAFSEPIHTGSPGFTWAYLMICGIISTQKAKHSLKVNHTSLKVK